MMGFVVRLSDVQRGKKMHCMSPLKGNSVALEVEGRGIDGLPVA